MKTKSRCDGSVTETHEDTAWALLGDERSNGLPWTRAAKERAIVLAIELKPYLSDRAIAAHVGVSHQTVANRRAEFETCKNERGDSASAVPGGEFPHSKRTIRVPVGKRMARNGSICRASRSE
jgi:hypothetical protein